MAWLGWMVKGIDTPPNSTVVAALKSVTAIVTFEGRRRRAGYLHEESYPQTSAPVATADCWPAGSPDSVGLRITDWRFGRGDRRCHGER